MSDWGAVHSTVAAANNGLDQQSGYPFDDAALFRQAAGRRDCRRHGAGQARSTRWPAASCVRCSRTASSTIPAAKTPIDTVANAAVSRADAEQAAVLLKNDRNLLPLRADARRIVLIGSYADRGVLSGGGSSQVYPEGLNAVPGPATDGLAGAGGLFPVIADGMRRVGCGDDDQVRALQQRVDRLHPLGRVARGQHGAELHPLGGTGSGDVKDRARRGRIRRARRGSRRSALILRHGRAQDLAHPKW